MLFLIWFLLTLAIILSLDLVSFALGRKGTQRFFSTFFLFFSQIVITQFLLGLSAVLSGVTVALLNLLVTSCVLILLRRSFGATIFRRYIATNVTSARHLMGSLRGDVLYMTLLFLALVLVGWISILGLLFPVTDVDGNSYHMTFIAQAIQNNHIYDVSSSVPWLAGYPKGGELIQMWNVIIPNNDALADLAQVPFLLLGIVSLYVISVRVGVEKGDARFASLLFLFLPIVINQAKTTYVDIMLSALFLAALAIVTKKGLSWLDLVITGVIFSLLIAVKSTGLIFVLACVPFLLMNILKFKKHRLIPEYKQYMLHLGLVFLPMLFGLYWYIKNLFVYGSPLYPFGLKAFGVTIFPGRTFQDFIAGAFTGSSVMPADALQRLWFVWTEQKDWFGCLYNYDSTFSGLGPVWFTILIPSILVATVLAIKRRQYLFLALTVAVAVVFAIYPANFYARYTIFLVLAGVMSFGLVATLLGDSVRRFSRIVAIGLALVVIATTFTLCNFSPTVIRNQINNVKAGHPREGLAYRNTFGDSYLFLQNRVQAGETVAYGSAPYYIYPLWKADFSNRVVYLPVKDKAKWYKELAEQDVKYVFTNLKGDEHDWIEKDARFKTIFRDKINEIYEVQ